MKLLIVLLAACVGVAPLAAQVTRADTVGRILLTVREAEPDTSSRDEGIILHMETVEQYSCLGFAIGYAFTRRRDTLAFRLTRIVPPGMVCPAAIGPAHLQQRLRLATGRYAILIDNHNIRDRFELDVTDSSFAVVQRSTHFATADDRLWWRRPQRSIAFACENVNVAFPVCDDVRHWLGEREDMRPLHFGTAGVNPYWPDSTRTPDLTVATFLIADDSVLPVLRHCFADVGVRISQAVACISPSQHGRAMQSPLGPRARTTNRISRCQHG